MVLPDAGNPQSTNKHRSAGFSSHWLLIQLLDALQFESKMPCPDGEPSL